MVLELDGKAPMIELSTEAIWSPREITTVAVVRISLEEDEILLDVWNYQLYGDHQPYSKVKRFYPLTPEGVEKAMRYSAVYLSQKGGGRGVLRQLERLAEWFKRNTTIPFDDQDAADRFRALIRIFGGHL